MHHLTDKRGQAFIEMLFVLPLLLLIFFVIMEMGFVMYDFAVVNYAASSAAVEAARKGQFDDDVADRVENYLVNYSSNGKNVQVVRSEFNVTYSTQITLWGPDSGSRFQRGDIITVGVNYPVRFKLFFIDSLAKWVVDECSLTLKSSASAMSEPYIEY